MNYPTSLKENINLINREHITSYAEEQCSKYTDIHKGSSNLNLINNGYLTMNADLSNGNYF
jgi:hypothetical protein